MAFLSAVNTGVAISASNRNATPVQPKKAINQVGAEGTIDSLIRNKEDATVEVAVPGAKIGCLQYRY